MVPVDTLVSLPKSMHAPGRGVLDLDRQVRLAHQRMSQQVDAVANMRRRCHHWQAAAAAAVHQVVGVKLLAGDGHVEHLPVAVAQAILDAGPVSVFGAG